MKDPFMAHLGFAVLHLAPGEAVVAGDCLLYTSPSPRD